MKQLHQCFIITSQQLPMRKQRLKLNMLQQPQQIDQPEEIQPSKKQTTLGVAGRSGKGIKTLIGKDRMKSANRQGELSNQPHESGQEKKKSPTKKLALSLMEKSSHSGQITPKARCSIPFTIAKQTVLVDNLRPHSDKYGGLSTPKVHHRKTHLKAFYPLQVRVVEKLSPVKASPPESPALPHQMTKGVQMNQAALATEQRNESPQNETTSIQASFDNEQKIELQKGSNEQLREQLESLLREESELLLKKQDQCSDFASKLKATQEAYGQVSGTLEQRKRELDELKHLIDQQNRLSKT